MAEQTIRVNVPDGYEVVRIGVPNTDNGDLILSRGEVIVSPPTVYDRVIVRKIDNTMSTQQQCSHVDMQRRASLLRDRVMPIWYPPHRTGNESIASVSQTSTMQTIAWIMGPEFLGKLDRNQQAAIDSGMMAFRAALEGAKK